ncbi:MAG TPA: hypothetical protein VJ508_19145, partial [Saprospiraceae bacterium]|nr:hypothetical protein [Saprospiraceae bacterium]
MRPAQNPEASIILCRAANYSEEKMMKMVIKATLLVTMAITAVAAYSAPGDSSKAEYLNVYFEDFPSGESLYLYASEDERHPIDYYYLNYNLGGHHFNCSVYAPNPKLDLIKIQPNAAKGSFKLTSTSGLTCSDNLPFATLMVSCTADGNHVRSEVGNGSEVYPGGDQIKYHSNENLSSVT